jgi:hypothetical protein
MLKQIFLRVAQTQWGFKVILLLTCRWWPAGYLRWLRPKARFAKATRDVAFPSDGFKDLESLADISLRQGKTQPSSEAS